MKLLDHHLADLRRSGLTDETIAAAGLYSEASHSKLGLLLNWTKVPARLGAALVFPFKREDGTNGYARIKPDNPRRIQGKPVKYESPKGYPNEIYIPPGTFAALTDSSVDLLFTEGEKKSLCANQFGFRTIGLTGVWAWKDGKAERLLSGIMRISMKGRRVFIVFDSDIADKPEIRDAESRLAHHLALCGATVKCVRLPASPEGKVGLDDYLVANGAAGLRKLLDEAIEPAPLDAMETKQAATLLEPASEVAAHLQADYQDGVCRLRHWRNTFIRYSRGRYVELQRNEVRARLVSRLNDRFINLRTSDAANCLMQIEAQALLPGVTEPPAWLCDDSPADWEPGEVLVARNALINLPAYVAGQQCRLLEAFPHDVAKASEPYPTPRSWTNVGRLLAAAESVGADDEVKSKLVYGCVGLGAGSEFIRWLEEQGLPDPEWLLAHPDRLVLPKRGDLAIAILSSVFNRVRAERTADRWEAACDVLEIGYGQCAEVAMAALGTVWKLKPDGHNPKARNGQWAEMNKAMIGK